MSFKDLRQLQHETKSKVYLVLVAQVITMRTKRRQRVSKDWLGLLACCWRIGRVDRQG